MPETPSIRGSVVRSSYEFLEKNLGAAFLQRTFAQLSFEDRAALQPPILPLAWYPVKSAASWNESYERELTAIGKDPEVIKVEMRKSLGGVFRSLYSLMFSIFSASTIIGKLPLITERIYNCIQATVVENRPGRALLRYQGPSEIYQYFRATLLEGLIFILELGGVRGIKSQFSKDVVEGDRFTLEVQLDYQT